MNIQLSYKFKKYFHLVILLQIIILNNVYILIWINKQSAFGFYVFTWELSFYLHFNMSN